MRCRDHVLEARIRLQFRRLPGKEDADQIGKQGEPRVSDVRQPVTQAATDHDGNQEEGDDKGVNLPIERIQFRRIAGVYRHQG